MSQPIEELAREVFSDLGDAFDPATFADQEEEEEEQLAGGGSGSAAARGGAPAAAADEDQFRLAELISDLGSFDVADGEEEEAPVAVSGCGG